jgi:hypothetical protein
VQLLTDLIGDNQHCTVYQIQYRDATNTMQLGLSDALIAKGWDFKVAEYYLADFITFAQKYNYTIVAVETGKSDVVVYQGSYYGGAIGIDILDSYMY